jgi:predicted nucleic acid-binding protein
LTVFVDSSALYGLLDESDPNSARVAEQLRALRGRTLLTHNYVVVESAALVRRRFGPAAVRRLLIDVLPPIEIAWVDESIHRAAVGAFLAAGAARPSLVDYTSFELMRVRGVQVALAIDRDFGRAGFDVIPA